MQFSANYKKKLINGTRTDIYIYTFEYIESESQWNPKKLCHHPITITYIENKMKIQLCLGKKKLLMQL